MSLEGSGEEDSGFLCEKSSASAHDSEWSEAEVSWRQEVRKSTLRLPPCLREHLRGLVCPVGLERSLGTLWPRWRLWDLARPRGLVWVMAVHGEYSGPGGPSAVSGPGVSKEHGAPCTACLGLERALSGSSKPAEPDRRGIPTLRCMFSGSPSRLRSRSSLLSGGVWLHQTQEVTDGKPDCAARVDGSLTSESCPGEGVEIRSQEALHGMEESTVHCAVARRVVWSESPDEPLVAAAQPTKTSRSREETCT